MAHDPNTLNIFDGDGHVVEPPETFASLPEHLERYIPRTEPVEGGFRYICGDRVGFSIQAHPDSVGAPGVTVVDDAATAPPVAREETIRPGALSTWISTASTGPRCIPPTA